MNPANSNETARRYPEAYEWNVEREQKGRGYMKRATLLGILVGIGVFILADIILVSSVAKAVPQSETIPSLLLGGMLGLALRQWCYDKGMQMVVSAQQILVTIDTEHNTRIIAEALRPNQTVKS